MTTFALAILTVGLVGIDAWEFHLKQESDVIKYFILIAFISTIISAFV